MDEQIEQLDLRGPAFGGPEIRIEDILGFCGPVLRTLVDQPQYKEERKNAEFVDDCWAVYSAMTELTHKIRTGRYLQQKT